MCRYCHLHASSGCSTGTYVKAVLFRFQLSSSWYIHAGWLFTNDECKQAGLCLSYLFFFVLILLPQVTGTSLVYDAAETGCSTHGYIFMTLRCWFYFFIFYKQGLKTAVFKNIFCIIQTYVWCQIHKNSWHQELLHLRTAHAERVKTLDVSLFSCHCQ